VAHRELNRRPHGAAEAGQGEQATTMEVLRCSVPLVSLAVSAAALYSRAASSLLRPVLPRFAALLPVVMLFAAAPLAFTFSANVRGPAGFFLAWLGVFKLLLLAAGHGPLEPTLPILPFVFTALLPVKLRRRDGRPYEAGTEVSKAEPVSLVASAAKHAALLQVYQIKHRMHLYVRLALYGVHIYCFMDLLLPCTAAAGRVLSMEIEPQFDRPYVASSLHDFWGRRWNLVVSAILRPLVYEPVRVRARAGKAVAALCTFLVSGLTHEAMVYYINLQPPTGEACSLCAVWLRSCARATLLVVVFVAVTAFWLFFPPLCRDGRDDMLLQEWTAAAAFLVNAGRKLLRSV
jgi:hypothetical protein